MSEENYPKDSSMQNLVAAKTTITKSMPAIHLTVDPKTEMTLGAAKALNAVNYLMQMKTHGSRLGAKAYRDLLGAGSVTLTAKTYEFMALMGSSSRNVAYLRKLVNEVGSIRYSWDNKLEGNNLDLGFVNMFTSGRVHNGEVVFTIPPETRDLFITDKPVAVIDFLTLHENIGSKYGLTLNDLIQQQMFRSDEKNKTFTLKDSVLRNALNIKFKVEDGEIIYSYAKPADLKRKVIDVAVKDYNEAKLEYKVVECNYNKAMGEYYWTFQIEHHSEFERRAVLSELSGEILKISTALAEFGVSDQKKSELITSANNEYDVHFLLYCIQQTKNFKPKNKAAYFLSIFSNNKQAFDDVWAVRRLELENEKIARAEKHLAFIEAQKVEFKKQYKKAYINGIAARYNTYKEFPDGFGEALLAHCTERGRTLNAHLIVDAIKSKGDIDFASPAFQSFVGTWITDNMQAEMQEFVDTQTIIIPDF